MLRSCSAHWEKKTKKREKKTGANWVKPLWLGFHNVLWKMMTCGMQDNPRQIACYHANILSVYSRKDKRAISASKSVIRAL